MRPLIPIACLALASAAPTSARDRDAVPEAVPAGAPRDCIPLSGIRESRVRSDRIIDFVMQDRTVYRNILPAGGCPGLGFERRFSYATSLSQLCSVDIVTVLYTAPVQTGASCGLGKFQPVTLASR